MEAILKARSPENVQELQAFLGLLILRKIPVHPVDCISAIAQIIVQGTEVVVGTATRDEFPKRVPLDFTERNYSQLDKEGAAVMFTLTKFHKQIYGRCFVIMTDHNPLVSLFG